MSPSRPRPRGRPANSTTALVPAAAREGNALNQVETLLNAEAIEMFATALGGRERLADVLSVAGSGSEVERITALLLDPRYLHWSLQKLCTMVGLTVAELFAAYRKAAIARAHIEATHIIARRLPPIVIDVMDKATPTLEPCTVCQARGIWDDRTCWRCKGTGAVMSEPSVERHKLALELGQLLEKKGGLIVQQNTLAAASVNASAPGSLEHLQQAVGDLLFGGPRRRKDGDVERGTPPADLPSESDDPVEEEPFLPFDDDDLRHPPPLDPRPPRPSGPGTPSTPADA